MQMRVGFVLWALVACSGGGGVGDPDAVTIDGAVIDGSVIDGALIDGAPIDAALIDGTPIDGALIDGAPIDAALIDGTPIDSTPTCAVDPPVAIAAPLTTRPLTVQAFGRSATFELATPVALESLAFKTTAQPQPLLLLRASCTGPVIATGVWHQIWLEGEIAVVEWTDGVAPNLAAGSYVFEILFGIPFPQSATLEVHGVIVDGAACDDPLVAAGVLACSPGATCTAGVCVVASPSP